MRGAQLGTATELRLARMACFWSLPEAVRARKGANETPTGHLKCARRSQLAALLAQSGRGEPKEFGVLVDAFNDLMDSEERR